MWKRIASNLSANRSFVESSGKLSSHKVPAIGSFEPAMRRPAAKVVLQTIVWQVLVCAVAFLGVTSAGFAQETSEPTKIVSAHKELKRETVETSEVRLDSLANQWAQMLTRGRRGARLRAAQELANMGASAAPAIDSLLLALTDGEAAVRLHAAQAIGNVGVEPQRCIPLLNELLGAEDRHLRYAAERALAQFAMQPVKFSDAKLRLKQLATTSQLLKEECQSQQHRLIVDAAVVNLQRLLAAGAVDDQGLHSLPERHSSARTQLAGSGAPKANLVAMAKPATLPDESWHDRISRFESAGAIERLRIIDWLGVQATIAPSKLGELRADVLGMVLERNDVAERELVSARWPKSGIESFRKNFLRAATQQLQPDWMELVLQNVRGEQYSDIIRLSQIVENKLNSLPVRAAALEAVGRSVVPSSRALALLGEVAFDKAKPLPLRLSALTGIGVQAKNSSLSESVDLRLWRTLQDPNESWDIRMACFRTLAKIGANPIKLESEFLRLMQRPHQDDEIASALQVIPQLEVAHENSLQFVPSLLQELQASEESLRLLAARASARVKPNQELVEALLLRLVTSQETQAVSAEILRTLATYGPESLARTSEILWSSNVYAARRIELLELLAGLGESALPVLDCCLNMLEDEKLDLRTRVAAAVVIGRIGGKANSCEEELEEFYARVNHPSARAITRIALLSLADGAATKWEEIPIDTTLSMKLYSRFLEGDTSVGPLLTSLLEGPEADYASQALLDLGEPAADSLENLLADDSAKLQTRRTAATLLTRLPNKSYRRLVDHVDEPVVGEICEQCLAELKVRDKETEFLHSFAQKLHTTKNLDERRELKLLAQGVVLARANSAAVENVAGSNASLRLVGRLREDIAPDLVVATSSEIGKATREMDASIVEVPVVPNPAIAKPSSMSQFPAASDAAIASENDIEVSASPPALTGVPPTASAKRESAETVELRSNTSTNVGDGRYESASSVTVYYGTNRKRLRNAASEGSLDTRQLLLLLLGAVCIIGVWTVGILRRKWVRYGVVGLVGCGVMALWYGGSAIQAGDSEAIAMTRYGGELGSQLIVGKCEVSIPKTHRPGKLESASLLKLEFSEDLEKHIVLTDTQALEKSEFLSDLHTTMAERGQSLLVFVHGYNVSFEDAARRTAQMSYDLEFPGAAAFFSWPSQDNWYKYQQDRKNIRLSVKAIRQFLTELADESGAETIHLVAHSMGNVGLTEALADLQTQSQPLFNQVVLAAPDIDADVFRQNIAPEIVGKAEKFTLYTSQSDLALLASRYFNSGKRVGESQAGVQFPGIDVIDASEVDTSLIGHTYYGQASVLADVRELFENRPVQERTYLKTRQIAGASQHFLESGRIAGAPAIGLER